MRGTTEIQLNWRDELTLGRECHPEPDHLLSQIASERVTAAASMANG